jgi:16S rRNA (guanine527-N7)-methyltransferase
MNHPALPDIFADVSRETIERLEAYAALVRKWNPAINLVSKDSLAHLMSRHIADSVQVLQFAPASCARWVDLGSGGGFPGLVAAIMLQDKQPGARVTLVEADLRKATFLREVCRGLSLTATVLADRIEAIAPLGADVLSARALAPLTKLCDFAGLHMRPDGMAIFPKGARHQGEIDEARANWHFDMVQHPSATEPGAAILCLRNIRHA